jgi:hypothetical protein
MKIFIFLLLIELSVSVCQTQVHTLNTYELESGAGFGSGPPSPEPSSLTPKQVQVMELNIHGISWMVNHMTSSQDRKFVKQFSPDQVKTLLDTIDSERLRNDISKRYYDLSNDELYHKVKRLTQDPEFVSLLARKVHDLTTLQQLILLVHLGPQLRDALITAYGDDFSHIIKRVLRKTDNILPEGGFDSSSIVLNSHLGSNFPLSCNSCSNCINGGFDNPCGSPGIGTCDVCFQCNCGIFFGVTHNCTGCQNCTADFGAQTSRCNKCSCNIKTISSYGYTQHSFNLLTFLGCILIILVLIF